MLRTLFKVFSYRYIQGPFELFLYDFDVIGQVSTLKMKIFNKFFTGFIESLFLIQVFVNTAYSRSS